MKYNNTKLSIVSPVYKAENIINDLVEEIIKYVTPLSIDFEIILVDDGSPDKSWDIISKNCLKDNRVKGIKLSRNFGQHNAITAGLRVSTGNWVVVMDCDLQDRPQEIIKLYEKALEGYQIVFARRRIRQDSFIKKLSSKIFYIIFSYLTETKQDSSIANYGIYSRQVINNILDMNDHIRYFPTMAQWVGFRKTAIDVTHGARQEGKTTYSWKKLFNLAWNNITSFSDKPLRIVVTFGFLLSTFSFLIGIYFIVQYLNGYITVPGFASLFISLWFLGGMIIFVIGIVGIYIGKIFENVKGRPTFIIEEKINTADDGSK